MKNYFYVICLMAAFAGMVSCSKNNDPAPTSVVVGKWSSDYILVSGFVGSYTANNGLKLNPLVYGINDNYDIRADKTFTVTDRSSATIQSYPGTWDYAEPTLSLKYDNGTTETLTYTAPTSTTTTAQLSFPVQATSDTLTNPTTKLPELVKYNVQLVYTKQ